MFDCKKLLRTLLLGVAPTAIVLALSAVPPSAYAADVNARIRGTVTDPAGAVIPNVTVTATNQASGVKYTTTSQANGEYLFQQLPIGTYTISASAPGFKSYSASGIVLNIDQEYVETVKLSVGSASDVVEIQADAVQVNTTDAQLSNIVDSTEIVELPLIGRNFTALELIEPGVQLPSDRFGTNYSVSGAQTQQSEYLINGADSNDISLNTLAISPNLDAIEQFNLIEGPLNAEYDRNSGGIVSATVKAGTNKFHGDGFEFYRDTFLNTLSYYQKPALTSPPAYHQNIFGGTVGGPVLRDKLFFFFGYQGTRQRTPDTASNIVYSDAQRGGDFSGDLGAFSSNIIPGTISIPGCSAGETWAACLTPLGGKIPTSAFNSISANLLNKYVPTANSGSNGYFTNGVAAQTINQEMGRMDYALNPKNQFNFVGIYQKQTTTSTLPFTGATVPGFAEVDGLTVQQYTFDYVRQISSTTVNDFALHWTRFNYDAVEPASVVTPSSLGFSISPQNAAAASVPTISVSGAFELGFSTNGPQPRIDQVYQIDETLSKVVGHHNLKFGYDGRRFNVSNPFNANNSGSYSFSPNAFYTSGDPLIDFLVGNPGGYSQGTGAKIQADAFLNYVFAQDSWKVTPTFTLNYGLGYSIDTPLHNHQYGGEGIACLNIGQTSTIFPTAPVGIAYPGDPGCYNSGKAQTKHTELGPRFGFAWAPDLGVISGAPGKFSVYGGFGLYYNRSEEETALQTLETPPFGLSSGGAGDYGASAPGFANPYSDLNTGATFTNKFPFTFPSKGAKVDFTGYEPLDISTYGKDFRASYAENFQVSVERELPQKMVTRISYVGSLARHNQVTYDSNPETAAGHASCAADPVCIANRNNQIYFYPQHNAGDAAINPITGAPVFTSIGTVGSEAASSYHALQASIRKGVTHGLTMQVSYTYSHALDNGSSFENSGFGESGERGYNQYKPSLNYGDSASDARHHFVIAPIYVTPKFRGKSDFNPLNLALSGWEVSGIVTLSTGEPYDISYAGGTSRSLYCSANWNFYACPDVPEQVAAMKFFNPRHREFLHGGYSEYFSPKSFVAEPIGVFGNVHRNPYHGPGANNTNMILAKNFFVGGDNTRRLQVRMESDNVFNHTQFNNPTGGFTSSLFGFVTGSAAARQTQLATKFYF
jgi:hypothetical protein